jgi:hypothetical protein
VFSGDLGRDRPSVRLSLWHVFRSVSLDIKSDKSGTYEIDDSLNVIFSDTSAISTASSNWQVKCPA